MTNARSMEKLDLTLLGERVGFQGFFRVDILDYRHTLFQGGWTPSIEREVFGRGQAVVVLLFDLEKECAILVEQCRAGAVKHALAENQPDKAWLLEPVAGMIDTGETPEQACQREVREEAGIEIDPDRLQKVISYYPSPGGCDEILHIYAAEIDSNLVPEYAGLANEVEDIRLVKHTFSEVKQGLTSGQYNVSSTLIALQWLVYQYLPALSPQKER